MKKQILIASCIFSGIAVLFTLFINRSSFLYNHSITVQNNSGESIYHIIVLFPDGKLRLINMIDNGESAVVSHPTKIEGLTEIFFSTRNGGRSSWFHESGSYVAPNLKSNDIFKIEPEVVQPVSSDLESLDSGTDSGEKSQDTPLDSSEQNE